MNDDNFIKLTQRWEAARIEEEHLRHEENRQNTVFVLAANVLICFGYYARVFLPAPSAKLILISSAIITVAGIATLIKSWIRVERARFEMFRCTVLTTNPESAHEIANMEAVITRYRKVRFFVSLTTLGGLAIADVWFALTL